MNIIIKIVDVRTYQVLISESDDHKPHEKPTLVQEGNSLEIAGKHDGNSLFIRIRIAHIVAMAIDEGEQFATVALYLQNMTISIRYAYYKMGNLNKAINHKFKEDVALLESLLSA